MSRNRRDAVTSRLRLRSHDYGEPAAYVVTLCTEGRVGLFGEILDGVMVRSTAGEVVASWWETIPAQFPTTSLDAMVVMPNHLHGIVMIGIDPVPEAPEAPPSLSRVMQWFQSVPTTDYARGVHHHGWPPFAARLWQRGFSDHIIRDGRDLERVRRYIEANPAMWPEDEFNS